MTAPIDNGSNATQNGAAGLEKKLGECRVIFRIPASPLWSNLFRHSYRANQNPQNRDQREQAADFVLYTLLDGLPRSAGNMSINNAAPPATGLNPSRPAYVPPHMRGSSAASSNSRPPTLAPTLPVHTGGAPANGGDYAPRAPGGFSSAGRGGFGGPGRGGASLGGGRGGFSSGGGGSERVPDGFGAWRDGQHVVGNRHMRMEKELYGEEGDGAHQVSLHMKQSYDPNKAHWILCAHLLGLWNQL